MTAELVIPDTADELAEMLADGKRLQPVFDAARNGNAEPFQEFIRKYASNVLKKDADVMAQLREQTEATLADFLKDQRRMPPVNFAGQPDALKPTTKAVSRGRGTVYNKAAPGAKLEEAYKEDERFASVGEYCQAIREEARPSSLRNRQELLKKLENVRQFQNSFGSEVPGDGGFLIPEGMRSDLLQLALEDTIVRSRASVIPMSTLRVPVPNVDDTSHTASLFGGVQFFWAEESSSIPESQASFGRTVLEAKKLTGFFKVPNELLADAPAFSGWFDTRIPQGLAWAEDRAFLSAGTGVGEPQAVISSGNPAYIQVTRNLASNVKYVDIVSMYARMLPASLGSAVWIADIGVFPQLAQMTLSTPGVWMGGYNVPGVADAPPISIFGRPVFFTEKVPALGTLGDISFVDLSYYLLGDRQAVALAASEHFAFQNDQTAYRITERVDGRPWVQSALTPANAGPTLSPYVGLL